MPEGLSKNLDMSEINMFAIYIYIISICLVGGLESFLLFHVLGIIFPTDELIFFRGVGIPPTRYTIFYFCDNSNTT